MRDKRDTPERPHDQAEEGLAGERVDLQGYSRHDLERLIHELRVHQVELDLQNDALRRAQVESQLTRDEYARLYNEAPVGYFSVDDGGRIAHVNLMGAALLGNEPAALIGRPFNSYLIRESREDLRRLLLRLLRMRVKQTARLVMRRADGSTFPARVEGVPDDRNSGAWWAVISDISEEQRIEEALAESEARYRHLVEYAPSAIYEVEVPSGRFVAVNEVMSQITGYTREELLSMSGFDLTDEEGRDLFAERLRRMAAGLPVPEAVEFRVFTKDGRELFVLLHTRLVIENGKPSRIFVIGYDITDRKRAEEDLRLIMEGTAALTGRDFFRALVRHLSRLLDARCVLVGWLDDEESRSDGIGMVHTRAVWAYGDWADNFTFELCGSACEQVVHGEPCYYPSGFRHLFPDDPLLDWWEIDGYRALPLRDALNEIQGVLVVTNDRPMDDDPRAEPILNIFADRAAAELMRQESEVALRRYANQQSALYAVASTLTTSLDPEEILDRVLNVIVPLFGADVAWVTVLGIASQDPPLVLASRGLTGGKVDRDVDLVALAAHINICPACTAYRDSAGHAAPRVIYNCGNLPPNVFESARLQSHACLPLVAHGDVLGILMLGWHDDREPGRAEERLLLSVGYQVALGLHNARLHQHSRQVDRLYMLAELNDALTATLDPARVAEVALQSIGSVTGATQGLLLPHTPSLGHYPDRVLSLDGEWIDVEQSARYDSWRPVLERLHGQRDHSGWIPGVASVTEDEAGQQFLVVPVEDRDGELADLVLSGRSFTDDDVVVAWAAAGRTGQAIRNAQLYEEVRELLHEREERQAQLVHSEKMAALGRLTASVSHEINNPVQAVLGCIGLAVEELDEDADEEIVDRYLEIAMQELRRIAGIVRRMREFYRPAEHEWDEADMNDTIEAVVDLTRNELLGHDVQIEMDLGQVPRVPIRPDQMRQVFLNLILNAADAMPVGGTLTLRTRLDETRRFHAGERAVRIEFVDTGTGIGPDVHARLFEPFFTTKREGSGLGLYISHGIVEAHGGEIEVESQEGVGTTVRVWLPLEQDIEPAES